MSRKGRKVYEERDFLSSNLNKTSANISKKSGVAGVQELQNGASGFSVFGELRERVTDQRVLGPGGVLLATPREPQ
jgi:hypothetical protein